jgi:carboxylate-amine ligase
MAAFRSPDDRKTPEELTFHPSPAVTLGVELELQIVDRATGELVPGAQRILDACANEELQGVDGEFLLSMLEVKTGICEDVATVREQLFPLLRGVGNIASTLGYDLAVGGTHPFSRPSISAISPQERYQRIRKRQGWLAYHEAIFGLHVHVGVPDEDAAVGLMNLLTPYLPHLLALSANSPFWQGVDTEHASVRATLFRPAAHAGVPPHFADWRDLGHYYEVMKGGGAIEGIKDLYWDVRPRPDYGTVEVRIFDAPASPACLLALVALTRCMAVDALRRLRDDPSLGRGDPGSHWLAAENKTLAARYGLRAECIRCPGEERRTLAADLDQLFDRLIPIAKEIGEYEYLAEILHLDRFESGAERQRRLYRQSGNWHAVLDDTKSRWDRGLDAQPSQARAGVAVRRDAASSAEPPGNFMFVGHLADSPRIPHGGIRNTPVPAT